MAWLVMVAFVLAMTVAIIDDGPVYGLAFISCIDEMHRRNDTSIY